MTSDRLRSAYEHVFQLLAHVRQPAQIVPGRSSHSHSASIRSHLDHQHPTWSGPTQLADLVNRVRTLAVLDGLLPSNRQDRLDDLVLFLDREFKFDGASSDPLPPSACSLAEIQQRARLWQCDQATSRKDTEVDISRISNWLSLDSADFFDNSQPFDQQTKKTCAAALVKWQTDLRRSPQWNKLAGMTPVDEPVNFDDVYVDLFVRPQTLQLRDQAQLNSTATTRRLAWDQTPPAIGIDAMVATTGGNCLVLGEPGSGKTTLIQWLARQTCENRLPGFELAIVIRLKEFAAAFQSNPRLNVMEFFIASQLEDDQNSRNAGACLRTAAKNSGKFLLLLDGWDEVPSHLRHNIAAALRDDTEVFKTVVASRVSGLPWQDFEDSEIFETVPLETNAIENLVAKRIESLGRPAGEVALVLQEIQADDDFSAMATNPFLLGMIIRLLINQNGLNLGRNRSFFYRQILAWMTDQNRQSYDTDLQVASSHLRALERLAFRMTVEENQTRYSFGENEIDLDFASPNSLPHSRFIQRVSGLMNTWSFLHRSLQEFLAACYLARQNPESITQRWTQLLFSSAKSRVLAFYAGLNAQTSDQTARQSIEAIQEHDQFGIIVIRVAEIAMRADWPTTHPRSVQEIGDYLWTLLLHSPSPELSERYVRAFVRLDRDGLVKKIQKRKRIPDPVQQAVMQNMPAEEIFKTGAIRYFNLQLRSQILNTIETIDRRTDSAESGTAITGQLLNAVLTATKNHDAAVAVKQLALTFNSLADQVIADLLTKVIPTPSIVVRRTLRNLACAALRFQSDESTGRLNPSLRDDLLKTLAIADPNDERVLPILETLQGYSIDCGGELIAQITIDRKQSAKLRAAAVIVMQTVVDHALVQKVVATAIHEPATDVAKNLFALARKRSIAIPIIWLKKKIESLARVANHPITEIISQQELIAFFLMGVAKQRRKEQANNISFIEKYFYNALTNRDEATCRSQAIEMRSVLRQIDSWGEPVGWSDHLILHARMILSGGMADEQTTLEQMSLAFAIIAPDQSLLKLKIELFHFLLDQKHSLIRAASETVVTDFISQVASFFATASPDQLLSRHRQKSEIQSVLVRLSLEEEMLIFPCHAYDAHGQRVVDLERENSAAGAEITDEALRRHNTWNSLPPMQRRALKSFQIVTDQVGLNVTLKEIHSLIDSSDSYFSSIAREHLEDLYRGIDLPCLTAWRRSLNHATKKLETTVDGQRLLSELGLPRR